MSISGKLADLVLPFYSFLLLKQTLLMMFKKTRKSGKAKY